MLTEEEKSLSRVIFRLLKQATNQQVVKDFLKQKGVPTSAQNWDELFDKRIEPALSAKKFSIAELRSLLQQVEEYGRQHTFLYTCPPQTAQDLMSALRISTIAKDLGLQDILSTPLDLELPEKPTIVDIRLEQPDTTKPPVGLTIKVVETRNIKSLVSEFTEIDTKYLVKRYSVTRKRAVSIAHLGLDGILEIRIASQDTQSRYGHLVSALIGKIHKFIPMTGFTPVHLNEAKNKILQQRDQLADDIRYSHSTAKNDLGAVMQISLSSQDDNLSSDDGSMAALDSFLAGDGHVTGTNVYVKIPHTDPPREIHLLISGDSHEFAIPVACSAGEYAHVRGKIVALNS